MEEDFFPYVINMARPTLQAMNAFRRVVELRSFHAAARSLELTGGAVSKLVTQLERDVGVTLLHRTTRSVAVSAAGSVYYESAVRILDEVDAVADAVRAATSAPSGRLRVSVPTSFALTWLSGRLPRFVAASPRLELDLVLNDRFVDLVQDGFDCALRISAGLPDSTLVARPLGRTRRLLVGARKYLAQAPPLEKPADLASHACLLYSLAAEPDEWPVRLEGHARPLRVRGICRVNNSVMLRDMLLAGLGVALLPEFVVADLVRSGELEVLLPAFEPPPLIVHGVAAQQKHLPQKVRVFLDFVADEMSAGGAPVA
jgi:DNA-binding transcriptional LysR family regulator